MSSIIFMGTPEFAVPALQALHTEFGVRAVVTIPDKARGRGLNVQPSEVKQTALDLGIDTILQPASLKDPAFAETLSALDPDILCVIAFRILPRSIYTMAKLGAFNVHASLLPRYRGAAPINHAIINGDRESGVTSFLLNDVVDTGNILLQERCDVPDGMTAGELYARLMPLAADCAVQTVRMLRDGTTAPILQLESLASPAPKVFRETSRIDWTKQRRDVRNFIHGLSPVPCAWTHWNGEVLKIYHAALADEPCPMGTFRMTPYGLLAGCADGTLLLSEIQTPGKKRMRTTDMLRGYRGPVEGTFA